MVERAASCGVDLALCIADALPRSVRRKPLSSAEFVYVYDPRQARLPKCLTKRAYFAHGHVIVSYAGDARGIVEASRTTTSRGFRAQGALR